MPGVVGVVAEPVGGAGRAEKFQLLVVVRAGVAEHERDGHRGVAVDAVAHRRGQRAQVAHEARADIRDQRLHVDLERGVVGADLLRQLEQPRPAVGALEEFAVRGLEIRRLGEHVLGRQVLVQHAADLGALGEVGKHQRQAHQHPVLVNARVPVVAAVEGRVQLARRAGVRGAVQRVLQVVRILPADVGQAQLGEFRGLGGGKDGKGGGHGRGKATMRGERLS